MQAIRDRMHGVIALGLIGLIAVIFTLWGVGNYFNAPTESVLAKINGEKLTWERVDKEYERIARQSANAIEDTEGYKKQIANALINNEALFQAIAQRKVFVNQEQILSWLMEEPQFKDEAGNFSQNKFLEILHANYYTEKEFTRDMQRGLMINQFEQGMVHTAFALPFEVTEQIKSSNQKRTVNYLTIQPKHFEAQLVADDKTLESFYQAHLAQYQTPAQVKVEYLDLSYFDLANKMTATPAEAKQYYQDNLQVFTVPAQAHASHILISLPKNATEEQTKKAEETLALVQKRLAEKESFTDLAKTFSDDSYSAKKGGDLDWFSRGMMDPVFEEKVFAMKTGEISEPVKTDYGYHIIYLNEKKDETVHSFEQVKETVLQLVKTQKADAEMTQKGEEMTTLAFEHPDGLAPVAEQLGLTVKSSDWLTVKNPSKEGVEGDALFLKTAFSEDLIAQRVNSEMIEINPQHYVVMRVVEHQPERQQDFAEVKLLVEKDWKATEAHTKALALGEELKSKLGDQAEFNRLLAAHQLVWQTKSDLNQGRGNTGNNALDHFLSQVAFDLPRPISEKPAVVKTIPQGEDIALVQLAEVKEGADTGANSEQDMITKMLSQAFGRLDYQLFVKNAIGSAKIERFEKAS